ncbi:hypothetical protein [Denitromonas iodatirespirans]|uniref:Uncharacterized protein n=1 Tax=Denitromonas iodatirespirans TaxID=2795389 RepID=A0A944H9I3_DENI1|nr:hypothetical protein [Denitromonas iodatirespirans]MBT0962485.1 hypothetical protein [Denitromonas iodatirespirans]
MFVIRLASAIALILVGGSLVLYLLSGNVRYRHWAWVFTRVGLVVLLVFIALLLVERLLAPIL